MVHKIFIDISQISPEISQILPVPWLPDLDAKNVRRASVAHSSQTHSSGSSLSLAENGKMAGKKRIYPLINGDTMGFMVI